jgi:tRNA pseudouridine38-40 synthase
MREIRCKRVRWYYYSAAAFIVCLTVRFLVRVECYYYTSSMKFLSYSKTNNRGRKKGSSRPPHDIHFWTSSRCSTTGSRLVLVVSEISGPITHQQGTRQTLYYYYHSMMKDDDDDEYYDNSKTTTTKIRYRARLSYDGTHFYGFQYQSEMKRTVQGEVQKVLSKRFNQPVTLVGASRTDTGVHARGQAIHFDVIDTTTTTTNNNSSNILVKPSLQSIQYSINRLLPLDIRLWALSTTESSSSSSSSSWHAIRSAKCKLYSYRLFQSPRYTDPLQRYTRACIHNAVVDVSKLNQTLSYFVGTHDFRPFAGSVEQTQKSRFKKLLGMKTSSIASTTNTTNSPSTSSTTINSLMMMNTTRTIYRIDLVKESSLWSSSSSDDISSNNNYRIDFYIQGALYKMIRNIVGAAVEVSRVVTDNKRRQIYEHDLFRLLQLTNDDETSTNTSTKRSPLFTRRDNLSKPAPPEGLTLEWVFYDDDKDENFGCGWKEIEQRIMATEKLRLKHTNERNKLII